MITTNKSTISRLVNGAFPFLFSVSLFYLIATVVISLTALDSRYLYSSLDNSGFYARYCEELGQELAELSPASGIGEDFFIGITDEAQFESDIREFVNASYSGGATADIKTAQHERFREHVYTGLCSYAENEGYTVTGAVDEALTHLSELCAERYTDYTTGRIMGFALSMLGRYSRALMRYVPYAVASVALLLLFSAYYMYRLTRKNATDLFRRGGTALAASGLMCAVIPLFVSINNIEARVGISSGAIRAFFNCFLRGMLISMTVCSLILLCTGAVAGLYSSGVLNRLINRIKHKRKG